MKLSRFLTISFVLSFILFSCNKEINSIGGSEENNSIYISQLGYKFKESTIAKSGNKEKVVDVVTVDIDDDYMLVAELVNVGNIEFCETKSKQDVTNLTVVTFYDQESKGNPRLQNDITTVFQIPGEGGCTALFLGNVSQKYEMNGIVGRDGGKANSVNSGANLCWFSMPFTGSIPDGHTVDLSSMNPLFAQLTTITVNQTTQGATVTGNAAGGIDGVDAQWPIESVTNAKLVEGIQATSGEITFNKQGASYNKTTVNAEEALNIAEFVNNGASITIDKDVIPNNNNFALSADVKLKGQTSSKTAKFVFGTALSCGSRYAITLSVKKKGIQVIFNVNTQMAGENKNVYNPKFDVKQHETINKGTLGKDGVYYYKYGDVITLPNAPIREKYEDFNPMDVLWFEGWYKEKECTNKYQQGEITLNVENFESLKTSDVVNIYAHFNPIWYFYDESTPTKDGAVTARKFSDYYIAGSAVEQEIELKTDRFKKLPKRAELDKYFKGPIFHDDGYTYDKQDGFWFCKWEKLETYTNKPTNNMLSNANFSSIDGGVFKKEDFFFIPAFGIRDGNNERPNANEKGWLWTPSSTGLFANRQNGKWMFSGEPNEVAVFYGCMNPNGTVHSDIMGTNFINTLNVASPCYWPDPTYPTGPVI